MRIQYSAITERKSKAYKECVMSDQWNQLCVVSAMDYGKCSLWVICNCLCGVKVNVMEEWPLVVSEQKFMARICDSIEKVLYFVLRIKFWMCLSTRNSIFIKRAHTVLMHMIKQSVAAFPSTYFYAHFGLSHKKNAGWKRQDAHKF